MIFKTPEEYDAWLKSGGKDFTADLPKKVDESGKPILRGDGSGIDYSTVQPVQEEKGFKIQ